jgi:TRAP-type C4-dicarboxylate transport system permease small subunit
MPRSKTSLRSLSALAGAAEDAILVVLLSAMIALAGSQILLRNLFDASVMWGDPLLRVMVLWVGLLGAMAATRDDNHITVDILSRLLPPRAKMVGGLVTDLFTALVCGLIAYHAARFVLSEKADGGMAFASVPAWLCELILPVGFGVIAVRLTASFLRRARVLTGPKP